MNAYFIKLIDLEYWISFKNRSRLQFRYYLQRIREPNLTSIFLNFFPLVTKLKKNPNYWYPHQAYEHVIYSLPQTQANSIYRLRFNWRRVFVWNFHFKMSNFQSVNLKSSVFTGSKIPHFLGDYLMCRFLIKNFTNRY